MGGTTLQYLEQTLPCLLLQLETHDSDGDNGRHGEFRSLQEMTEEAQRLAKHFIRV